jgi:hypothetical protein
MPHLGLISPLEGLVAVVLEDDAPPSIVLYRELAIVAP